MPRTTDRQPAIFLPHGGGPCFFMDWTWGPAETWHATQRFLESLSSTLPAQPKALLVISGHWEEPAFTAGSAEAPELILRLLRLPRAHLPAHLARARRSGACCACC